jgi:lipopolysaccharide transport system ATP-binding protein
MPDPAIRIENLGKKYIIDCQQQQQYSTLRDTIASGIGNLFKPVVDRQRKSDRHPHQEEFWALKDISFEIKQGDRVGIIGRNGAGKSTLLKILSRITDPTCGQIFIKGTVSSLLEVGTGFHPELTGRENIFLNGAILGMSKTDIARKFDEIVDFAEVEKFLDTPVKRYSSGMYVRLAFAVAAHLEPEILIVDEVLAVGDSQFQKKCLGKMQNVAAEGRTVIFVSHQMAAINNLCSSCILLQGGELLFQGKTEQAITQYLESGNKSLGDSIENINDFRPSWAKPSITSARILDANGREQEIFALGADITFEMTFSSQSAPKLKSPVMGIVIDSTTFGTIGGVNTRMTGFETNVVADGTISMCCTLKKTPFLPGNYTADIWLGDGSIDLDTLAGYLSFRIEETDVYGTGCPPFSQMGVILLEPIWTVNPI